MSKHILRKSTCGEFLGFFFWFIRLKPDSTDFVQVVPVKILSIHFTPYIVIYIYSENSFSLSFMQHLWFFFCIIFCNTFWNESLSSCPGFLLPHLSIEFILYLLLDSLWSAGCWAPCWNIPLNIPSIERHNLLLLCVCSSWWKVWGSVHFRLKFIKSNKLHPTLRFLVFSSRHL